MIVLIIISLLIIYFFLVTSKSDFFYQSREVLAEKRHHLISVLYDFRITDEEIDKYLEAYNFFCENPSLYDGATIVKDLDTIKDLDANAMLHDFEYLFNSNLKEKLISDLNYSKRQERLHVGSVTAYTRGVLLIVSTPFYYLIKMFKK